MTDVTDAKLRLEVTEILRRHRGEENGIHSTNLAKYFGDNIGASYVRDIIKSIVCRGEAPIANGSDGYYWITCEEEYERERQTHVETKQTKQERIDGLDEAYHRLGTPTAMADGGSDAEFEPELRNAVDLIVEETDDPEAVLQDRFEDDDRGRAGLAYYRREYVDTSGHDNSGGASV